MPSIPEEDWEGTRPDPSRDRLILMCDGSCIHRVREYQRHRMYIQNRAIVGRQSLRQYSLQSPPRFEELQLRTLMHKKNSIVFGHIDFFGVLHHLIVSLGLRTLGPEAGVGDAFS